MTNSVIKVPFLLWFFFFFNIGVKIKSVLGFGTNWNRTGEKIRRG